jgi:protein SCO1/2
VALPELRAYQEVGEFTLIDQAGTPVDAASLRGKVWIANFIFTSCSSECLVLSHRMGNLQRAFAGHPDVRFVSFTVDPGTDTPERLARYAKTHRAAEGWSFLTGDRDTVDAVVRERFLLPLAEAEAQPGNFIHSDRFVLVDRHGMIRAYVNGLEPQAEAQVQAVVDALLREE